MRFKTRAEDGERGDSSDVQWKTIPQTSSCFFFVVVLVFLVFVINIIIIIGIKKR